MTTFNAGDQMAEYERLDTPAPEGKVVAWRYRQRSGAGGWAVSLEDMSDWPNLICEPLYASSVVPVGREMITAILESHIGAAAWSGDAEVHGIPEAADAILAALGTKATDTGREG